MNVPTPTYLVTMKITKESDGPLVDRTGTIEIPTFCGEDVARRRATWAAIADGWGADEVDVQSVELVALQARA